jgi:putative lipoprotein
MIGPMRRACGLLGLVVLASGCAADQVMPENSGARPMAQVTGTVTYRERIALPPTAVVTVKLVYVSRADAPAIVLGEQVIRPAGKQVPFAFSIAYDPVQIQPHLTYAVQARIEDGGRLLFISDRMYPVLTRDAPDHVDMVLRGT